MQIQNFAVPDTVLASPTTRFINYAIDFVVQIVIFMLLSVIAELCGASGLLDWLGNMNRLEEYLVGIMITLIYFPLLEINISQTVGKIVTGTIVVLEDGSKPDAATILKRTFCRLIPFDGLSFLGNSRGWHDSISNTYVVKKQALTEAKQLFHAFDEIGAE